MTRPRSLVAGAAAVVVLAAGALVAVKHHQHDGTRCSFDTSVKATSPLQSPARMKQETDAHLNVLASAVSAMGPPVGPVRAGLAYGGVEYLHLYGAGDGVLETTMNNRPVTYLDGTTLEPRWAIEPGEKRSTFDTTPDRVVFFDLAAHLTQVTSYALANGKSVWCTTLPVAVQGDDPITTTALGDGDVYAALGHTGTVVLSRLSGRTGALRWTQKLTGADRGDFLGQLDASTLLVGGREVFLAGDVSGTKRPPAALTAVALATGKPVWTYDPGPNAVVHVVGISGGHAILLVQKASAVSLVALSSAGKELWRRTPPTSPGLPQATLRGDVLMTASQSGVIDVNKPDLGRTTVLHGYDATTGDLLWSAPLLPAHATFAAGSLLDSMPSVDADHLLALTTRGLSQVDIHSGSSAQLALPASGPDAYTGTDTDYTAYQVLVTDHLIGIMTREGAVVADRTDATP